MNIASAYPELFWSRYNSLGSQIQSPKCSKVLISGVSFCQCSLLQSQESDVLNYSECKIDKNFQGFAPGPYWGELPVTPQTPHLHNSFSCSYAHWKTSTPQNCWIWYWWRLWPFYNWTFYNFYQGVVITYPKFDSCSSPVTKDKEICQSHLIMKWWHQYLLRQSTQWNHDFSMAGDE